MPTGRPRVHLVNADGAPLCPEAGARDAMSDADFWDLIFVAPPDTDDDWDHPDEPVVTYGPCPECGETGPCGYDAEGRPLMHLTNDDPED